MFEFLIIDFSVQDGDEIFNFSIPNKQLTNRFIKDITPIVDKYRELIKETQHNEQNELKQTIILLNKKN